jgi:hypothetical protein
MRPLTKFVVLTIVLMMLSGCCAVGDCWRDCCLRPANWFHGEQCQTEPTMANPWMPPPAAVATP